MATLSVTIIKAKPNKDGSYGVKIAIRTSGVTAYIATRYKIDNVKQWKDGRVVRHPDADIINRNLRNLLLEYETIYDAMPNRNLPATEIRDYLLAQGDKTEFVKEYGGRYVARLKEEGRITYAKNMEYSLQYLIDCLGEGATLQQIGANSLLRFEKHLRETGNSDTTINIRMSHIKAVLNSAVNDGMVEYKIFPFRNYKIPPKAVRDLCITKEELRELRMAEFKGTSERRYTVARDLFMLSFYFAGINLTDLMDAKLDGDTISFVRKKTATKKHGEKEVSLTIQPEARAIIDKYITEEGTLYFGYNYSTYEMFRSYVTNSLNRIGKDLGFEKRLMFYSARKTFVQYGTDLGIPLYILEYAIGQTIKDKANRPIHDYFRIMRPQADMAIRTVISYSQDMEEEATPIPEWARKYVKADEL